MELAGIWRYPVKSMGGERLARSAIAARGLHADRMWAVRDVELDTFTTARRWPVLLQCSDRFAAYVVAWLAQPRDEIGRTRGSSDRHYPPMGIRRPRSRPVRPSR